MTPARWTPSPVLEREVERGAQAVVRTVWLTRLFVVAALAGCPLSCFSLAMGPFWWPVALLYVPLSIHYWVQSSARREDARVAAWRRDADVIDEFGWGDGWLVELIVLQGAAPTGADRGMLWFEEGRMLFSGRRTSFALGPDAVDGYCREGFPVAGLRHGLTLRFRLRTAAGPLGLSFAPVARAKWQDQATAHDVQLAVNRWIAQGGAAGGQAPPLEVGPGAPSSRRLIAGAALSVGFWSALGVAFFALLASFDGAVSLGIAMVGIVVAVTTPALSSPAARVRAWRDRRRIEEAA